MNETTKHCVYDAARRKGWPEVRFPCPVIAWTTHHIQAGQMPWRTAPIALDGADHCAAALQALEALS